MTTGKSSRKSAKSPKFLDRASGFYGRLDETKVETARAEMLMHQDCGHETTGSHETTGNGEQKAGQCQLSWEPSIFYFNGGMMEDDGTATLLKRKPSRSSSRWRRSSSSRKREDGPSEALPASKKNPTSASATEVSPLPIAMEEENQVKPVLIHFSIQEEGDDRALIRKKKGKEVDVHHRGEMKVVKRSTLYNYRRAINKAFRRGWETFVANLNSVTLTPISSSSPHSSSAIAEYR